MTATARNPEHVGGTVVFIGPHPRVRFNLSSLRAFEKLNGEKFDREGDEVALLVNVVPAGYASAWDGAAWELKSGRFREVGGRLGLSLKTLGTLCANATEVYAAHVSPDRRHVSVNPTGVARDPFARGEYRRTADGSGDCSWCGQSRKTLYTYGWDSDGGRYSGPASGRFCGLPCFRDYHDIRKNPDDAECDGKHAGPACGYDCPMFCAGRGGGGADCGCSVCLREESDDDPPGSFDAVFTTGPRPRPNPNDGWKKLIADGKIEAADANMSRFRDRGDGRVEYVNDGIGWRVYRMGRETASAAGRRELGGRFAFLGDAYAYVHRGDAGRIVRPNPHLILVTGNPAPGAVEKAWCRFHQRDRYDGRTENFGTIKGMPPFVFALGKCRSVEIAGAQRPFRPQPWLVCSPDDDSLWIVTKDVMNLGSDAADRQVSAITYDPPAASGKQPAYYRHEFSTPRPVLTPVGNPHRCRAVLLDGGVYRVTDWVHD